MTSAGGLFSGNSGLVLSAVLVLESKVGQQPTKIWLVCGVEFSGLFGSRARGKYFINNLLKTDCQRSANLLQSLLCVYGGLLPFYGMLSAT
ncbi:hypothetical protein D1115_08795 [Vibrio alfacsensis]|uniref:DUF3265 domain-containing protein n=1 Tax=Vibrio alfacsensis TaxID=1074311 RepID=A0ABM6YU28_9VIBR|nr:hypothetical protein D1115_08795 [Vibrio alfacsensis]